MNDTEIDAAIAVHEAAIEALRELRRVRVPSTSAPAAARRLPIATRRWELAAKAFRRFPFEPHKVRRICANHINWAARLTEGTWYVDVDLFNEFADKVDRGEARFDSSEKFASSLANDSRQDKNQNTRTMITKEGDGDQNRETA
jgi:hypothetical protein